MNIEKYTKIFKINCPNCDAEVWDFEIVAYYLNGEFICACPHCGDK